jgi:hypothetical protein
MPKTHTSQASEPFTLAGTGCANRVRDRQDRGSSRYYINQDVDNYG